MTLNLLGNAPLLDGTNTYVQVSRDDFEAILNYAQHVASFKMGGAEFMATVPMLKGFYQAAANVNKRWATYGVFVEMLKAQGRKQDEAEPEGGIAMNQRDAVEQNEGTKLKGIAESGRSGKYVGKRKSRKKGSGKR